MYGGECTLERARYTGGTIFFNTLQKLTNPKQSRVTVLCVISIDGSLPLEAILLSPLMCCVYIAMFALVLAVML